MIKNDGTDLEYMLTDHQGSIIAALDSSGALITDSEKRYMPFGEVRSDLATSSQTDFGYTGQREIEGSELMDYQARFLNPGLGRFTQPDTIIPDPGNPQSNNRYTYTISNPIRYIDPSGHYIEEDTGDEHCVDLAGNPVPCEEVANGCDVPEEFEVFDPKNRTYNRIDSFDEATFLAIDFFTGTGFEETILTPDSSLALDIIFSPGVDEFKQKWAEAGYVLPFSWNHQIDERGDFSSSSAIDGLATYFNAHFVALVISALGLGSPTAEGTIDAVDGVIGSLDRIETWYMGRNMVAFLVTNEMGLASLTRIPSTDISIVRNSSRIDTFPFSPLGTTTQYVFWIEPYPAICGD